MAFLKRKVSASGPLGLEDLTISLQNLDADELLSEWRWLVDNSYSPVLLSAVGDLFLQGEDESIWWLCTADGKFTQVASTLSEFQWLATQARQNSEWFLPEIVGYFRQAGMPLPPGKCYSYRLPPFLGGKIEPQNMELTTIYIHFGFLGDVYKAVKDLPPGTKIRSIRLEKPGGTA